MAAHPAVVLEALERSTVVAARPAIIFSPSDSTYAEIEAVLGSELPPSARKFADWWGTARAEKGLDPSQKVWVLPKN